jgi:signal peptidase I
LLPFKLILVKGESMYPTLKNNQILLAMKTDSYERNDVVVAEIEDCVIIKRIAFIENDIVYYHIERDLNLPLLVSKNYFENFKSKDKSDIVQKFNIDKDSYFLLGDNLMKSDDSRRFGPINKKNIKYKIIFPRM